jgi:hypothetical protein
MAISRRFFLGGLIVSATSAPAIVSAGSLMRIRPPSRILPSHLQETGSILRGNSHSLNAVDELGWFDMEFDHSNGEIRTRAVKEYPGRGFEFGYTANQLIVFAGVGLVYNSTNFQQIKRKAP